MAPRGKSPAGRGAPRGGAPKTAGKGAPKAAGKGAPRAGGRSAAPAGRSVAPRKAAAPGRAGKPSAFDADRARDGRRTSKPTARASVARNTKLSDRAPREGTKAFVRDRSLGGEQIEGRQAVRELFLAGRKVRELWIATDMEDTEVMADIRELAAAARCPVTEVNRKRLDMAARSEAPQGVLALAAPLEEVELDVLLRRRVGSPPFLLALDGVTDPGNLGALLRTADGAGVTGVILPKHRAVHITPTVAKAAAGAIEHLPMAVVGGLPSAISQARDKGIWVVGLDDDADRTLFDLGDLGAEGVMIVLGAEGAGLSRLVRERCDIVVSIPMAGHLSSLNVAAAGALACYEIARARRT
jgi:23S rRNA (guanosine2251-2'-O)-methyltransferase